jgi:translation elongation factor EF-Tu-like GTPase
MPPEPDAEAGFRMPVADAFPVADRGLVAAGRIEEGSVGPGDTVVVERTGASAEVGAVETALCHHGAPPPRGVAGDHAGILLPGISPGDVRPGDVLRSPGFRSP